MPFKTRDDQGCGIIPHFASSKQRDLQYPKQFTKLQEAPYPPRHLQNTSKQASKNESATYVNSAGCNEILYVTPVLAASTRTVMGAVDDDVVDAMVYET